MAEKLQVKVVPDSTPASEVTTVAPAPELNPFAPESLRLDLNVTEGLGVKKVVATIPVRKPNNQDYIRVHPSPGFRLPVALIELKDDREVYLILPNIARDIPAASFAATMYTPITRPRIRFLSPFR